MNELFSLAGQVAVVTGALGRLGPVWIEALLEAGAAVAGVDLAAEVPVGVFAELQRQWGPQRLRYDQANVVERHSLERACQQLEQQLGPVTIVVNNAGIDQPPGDVTSYELWDWPERQFYDVFAVNVTGAFLTTQVFGRGMCQRRKGAIVNIGSLYASVSPDARFYEHVKKDPPFLKPPAYGASKAALVNLTRYLATHWAPYGVRVNSLSPGGVLGGQDERFKQKYQDRVPLGRMAQVLDLKGPLIFLAAPAASYITGIDLRVDGGFSAW